MADPNPRHRRPNETDLNYERRMAWMDEQERTLGASTARVVPDEDGVLRPVQWTAEERAEFAAWRAEQEAKASGNASTVLALESDEGEVRQTKYVHDDTGLKEQIHRGG